MKPLVSCLMATNRPVMCELARKRFCQQDYTNAVLQILPGDGTHGEKMNWLFRRAIGEISVVVDDDDEYAADRISKLVQPLIDNPKLNAVGTSLVYYVNEFTGKAWLYDNAKMPASSFWIGAPAYRKTAYAKYGPWENIKCGADLHFLRKLPRDTVLDLRDPNLMVCRIHAANAAGKQPKPPIWEEVPMESLPKFYRDAAIEEALNEQKPVIDKILKDSVRV